MTYSNFLKDTVSILRKSSGTDDFGHTPNTYSTIYTNVSCRISPISIEELELIGGETNQNSWRIQFPSTADVQETDRVNDGTNTFEIISVYKHYNKSSIHHIECIAEELHD